MDAGQFTFNHEEMELLKEVLCFAMKELGPEEFQTITGHGYLVAERTLKCFEN